MATTTEFLVAKRRGAHDRRGAEFLAELGRRTGLSEREVALVEPARSVELEMSVYPRVKSGLRDGTVARVRHLPLQDAAARCRQTLEQCQDEDVEVLLCRYPDFTFRCCASVLVGALESLVDFDGDTVTVLTTDGAGFALDVETEAQPQKLYEVDAWAGARRE